MTSAWVCEKCGDAVGIVEAVFIVETAEEERALCPGCTGEAMREMRAALAAAEARADAADKRAEYYQDFQGRLAEWRGVEVAELCKKCGGLGQAGYSDTSTWHGGMGGQAMTSDVCDKCWGSGIAKRPGADLRAMGARIKAAEARAERLAAIVRAMVRDIRASEMEEGRPEQECVSLDSICSLFGCPIEPGDLEDEA